MKNLLQHPIQRCIRQKVELSGSQTPAPSHITMVPCKPDLLQIHWFGLVKQHQGRLKLESTFMDRYSMSDVSSRRTDQVLVRLAMEGDLELADTVHAVK